jgi:hypothetical protein
LGKQEDAPKPRQEETADPTVVQDGHHPADAHRILSIFAPFVARSGCNVPLSSFEPMKMTQ